MFYFPTEKALIGGDLIIMGAVGRTDFPDANHDVLNASVRRVMQLPHDTHLLPGHGEQSLLGHELENNPYVMEAMEEERFLILSHPQVQDYLQRKAANRDRWLAGMRRLRDRIYGGQPKI